MDKRLLACIIVAASIALGATAARGETGATALRAAAQGPGASATPGSTATPAPIHLPVVRRDGTPAMRSDVVLLIDLSESMAGASLDAVRSAARAFVARCDPARDQVAIVGFDAEPRAIHRLSGDRAALDAAVGALEPGAGSRFDLALRAARHELLDFEGLRRDWRNRGVVVLITDGGHDGPDNDAIAEAFYTGNAGFAVFAVGLGPDADGSLLRAMADLGGVHLVADADGVEPALQAIADRLIWRAYVHGDAR
jgi:Mg-chelatase subunit ChlD